jgi:hypothetical protein
MGCAGLMVGGAHRLRGKHGRRKVVRQLRNAEIAAALAFARYRGLREAAVEVPVAPSPPLWRRVLFPTAAATVLMASLWAGLATFSVAIPAALILAPTVVGGVTMLVQAATRARRNRPRPPCVRDLVQAARALRQAEIALNRARYRARWANSGAGT